MTTKRREQTWVLNALDGIGGWDILHPGGHGIFEELGYFPGDIERTFSKVGAASM
jgi:hypothetical protein